MLLMNLLVTVILNYQKQGKWENPLTFSSSSTHTQSYYMRHLNSLLYILLWILFIKIQSCLHESVSFLFNLPAAVSSSIFNCPSNLRGFKILH